MKISCLMITTNLTNRLPIFENTIRSVESCNNGLFDSKTLSIDLMPGCPFDLAYFKQYESLGWHLAYGPCSGHRGMVNNISRGLETIDCDYLYYVEDDVLITRLPKKEDFEMMVTTKTRYGKLLGFICFNTHLFSYDSFRTSGKAVPNRPDSMWQEIIGDVGNYIVCGDELVFIKKEELHDEYYLNFPSAFINGPAFKSLIAYAKENLSGIGLEPGLTKSWFSLGLNQTWDVGIYVQPDTISKLPMGRDKFYHTANMRFRDNDSNFSFPSINDRQNTIF